MGTNEITGATQIMGGAEIRDGVEIMGGTDITGAAERAGATEIFGRLNAAVGALEGVDLNELSDAALEEGLDQLSTLLCQVDSWLAGLADQTRKRGFTIIEQFPATLELQLPVMAKRSRSIEVAMQSATAA